MFLLIYSRSSLLPLSFASMLSSLVSCRMSEGIGLSWSSNISLIALLFIFTSCSKKPSLEESSEYPYTIVATNIIAWTAIGKEILKCDCSLIVPLLIFHNNHFFFFFPHEKGFKCNSLSYHSIRSSISATCLFSAICLSSTNTSTCSITTT